MMAADEDALACDFAETYGILDMRALPAGKLATLAAGLRGNSRIKLRLAGAAAPIDALLLAAAVDRLSFLVWAQTRDGAKGRRRPGYILQAILGEGAAARPIQAYRSGEDFSAAWARITGR